MTAQPLDPSLPTTPSNAPRILSLDQFRGYTVVGMLLVNFIGGFQVVPYIFKHTHDYNSYADTIMPQFLFAVGFAMRLTFGRRVQQQGVAAAYGRMVRRLLGLVLVAMVVYAPGSVAENWSKMQELGAAAILEKVLKREWFQTLMHIAATSLWLLPVIRSSAGVRMGWMVVSALLHIGLSAWFNLVWVNSDPNGIDGGPLGFLTWCVPATFGTFACDIVAEARISGQVPPLGRMTAYAFITMFAAWVMSCGTRIYDVHESQREALAAQKIGDNPVFPTMDMLREHFKKPIDRLIAEPPFIHPPWGPEEHIPDPAVVAPEIDEAAIRAAAETPEKADKAVADAKAHRDNELKRLERLKTIDRGNGPYYRKWNYWMMSQRSGNLSYPLFAAGFALLVYVLFYVACDMWGWRLAFFETFGTNALLAYVVHSMVGGAVKPFVPDDAPGWWVLLSIVVFFWINWIILRQFEKNKFYLRV
ncbi:MAG: DUF1624 domain-containing protein [Planctomycetaceae bacterium]|nr:DUF1624 domain-containing protein [Planctomycetaceae bacterium]